MADALNDADSPWLVEPADELLTSLSDELAENAPKLDNAIDAVDLAPALLGAEGPRVYLVLFTTPSEARALGGFPGNYAEITVDNGSFAMTAFGRVADLERAGVDAGARLAGPAEFLAEYGRYGFDKDGNGLVGTAGWRNLTMTPHFPHVAEVAAQLYRQSAGKEIDGVMVMDPYVVQALLEYTGPIQLTTVDRQLTSGTRPSTSFVTSTSSMATMPHASTPSRRPPRSRSTRCLPGRCPTRPSWPATWARWPGNGG